MNNDEHDMHAGSSITVLTTVHPRRDIRVFEKYCTSFGKTDFDLKYVVADGKGDEAVEGISVKDLGSSLGVSKLQRFLKFGSIAFKHIWAEKPTVCHIHDPELLPFLIVLRLCRRIDVAVYDVHENLHLQLKTRLAGRNRILYQLVPQTIRVFEQVLARIGVDVVLTATENIASRFQAHKTTVVRNFPLAHKPDYSPSKRLEVRERRVVYAGLLSEPRGLTMMIEAVRAAGSDLTLSFAGPIEDEAEFQSILDDPANNFVEYHGFLKPHEMDELLLRSRVGLAVLKPEPNYLDALPTKVLDYVKNGVHVVASDFPTWRRTFEQLPSVHYVDPLNCDEITRAIVDLIEDSPENSKSLTVSKAAVLDSYTWEAEFAKACSAIAKRLPRGVSA